MCDPYCLSDANKVGSGVGEVGEPGIFYVIQYGYVGPVVLQHRLAIWILLHETGRAEMPGSLEATGKSTDASEQVYGRKDHQTPRAEPRPEIRNPKKIKRKYSGPILLSQFSFRFTRRHNFLIDLSLAVTPRAVIVNCPKSIIRYVNGYVSITAALLANIFHDHASSIMSLKYFSIFSGQSPAQRMASSKASPRSSGMIPLPPLQVS